MMRRLKAISMVGVCAAALCVGGAKAQQPSPQMIVVQPANQPAAAAPAAAAAAATSEATLTTAIKALEQIKAANDATLKKQEEMLQQLDELQKAAEQLKIFSKRV